ncbi:unnamed protein product [Lymnaea stagnalis]|uniref:Chitin-binding type-4 domain-containing protein n=1 Tax=Lymnaea stagnalis TaxID=6523 RepID=A0AAV2HEU5_LYMST
MPATLLTVELILKDFNKKLKKDDHVTMKRITHVTLAAAILGCLIGRGLGHGRLWDPPSRSSMWRQEYGTPINYQDNELFCGGFNHQLQLGYKCGICGDPYDGPRDNEEGGKYATGTITRVYQQGQRVTFKIDLTANHKGYFEFKICPTNDPKVKTTQECLDRYPVPLSDGSGTRYTLTSGDSRMYDIDVTLPAGLSCDQCVVQWRYHAGNSWGRDPDGRQCVGCGYQEEFYGCADIKILPGSGQNLATPPSSAPRRAPSSATSGHTLNTGNQINPGGSILKGSTQAGQQGGTVNGGQIMCRGVSGSKDFETWCQLNCQMGNCPQDLCVCENRPYQYESARRQGCRAVGVYSTVPGYDQWCVNNCAANNCPPSICIC